MSLFLPCPFCGERPDYDDGDYGFIIECMAPACQVRPSLCEEAIEDGDTECESRAVSAWNTRANLPRPPSEPKETGIMARNDQERQQTASESKP